MTSSSTLALVTTSWDDGHPLDLRVAEMLARCGMTGTFFVPVCDPKRARLSDADLRDLSSCGFEIGSHGMLHRNLLKAPRTELQWEITDSKFELEQAIRRKVSMFCYPIGRHDSYVLEQVRQAGYEGARTTRMLSTEADFDPMYVPTSIQAYRHSSSEYLKNLLRNGGVKDMLRYCTSLYQCDSWVELGRRLFDRVLSQGGTWHLYGHSWEIEKYGLWDELAEILAYVCNRPGVQYVRTVDTLRAAAPAYATQIA